MPKSYINQFELIKALRHGEAVNFGELLSTVNRQVVLSKVRKSTTDLSYPERILITEYAVEEENWSKMKEKDKDRIIELYAKLRQKPEKVVEELQAFQRNYPNVPAIYNYLSLCYQLTKQKEKYITIIFETAEKFPDYLFGKIALSEHYLNDGHYRKIPSLFENKFEIVQHFPPGTKVFHVSAVRSFYYTIGRYFVKAGKIEMAYKCWFLLYDLDKKNNMTAHLGEEIVLYEIGLLKTKFKRYSPNGIK